MPAVELRQKHRSSTVWIVTVLIMAAVLLSRLDRHVWKARARHTLSGRMAGLPRIMLWAWERPEDLGFINPRQVGVAFLAQTLYLRGAKVVVRPRLPGLSFSPGTALEAVVRIESDRAEPPALSIAQRWEAVSAIGDLKRIPGIAAVQVDFDATRRERAFYRDLLYDLRRQLPDSQALSITALASWCLGDPWLSGLPVDEAVPMLFRMGPDGRQVLLHLEAGGDFRSALCQQSVGLSTDEPVGRLPVGRRIYLFRPGAWSAEALRKVMTEVKPWQ